MKIKDAIKNNIRRVHCSDWMERNCYMKLPEIINGRYGPWIELYSEETQDILGEKTPQKFMMHMLLHGENSDCEEYFGPISEFDKEK